MESHMNHLDAGAFADAIARVHSADAKAPCAVEIVETHISTLFLTERFAYKIKKPVRNAFLDYSTLELRERFCHEEIRLDRRYAPDLYMDVVAFSLRHGRLVLGSEGNVCEYAVKMHRFPSDALLSYRLQQNQVSVQDIRTLASHVAEFHGIALSAADSIPFGTPTIVLQESIENLDALSDCKWNQSNQIEQLVSLRKWTNSSFEHLTLEFANRKNSGFVRECHGDMHSGNVVYWHEQFVPFDGIEFNDSLRWIDVMSDVAFLVMDLHARQHDPFGNIFLNSYLEQTGDYAGLGVLRWYLVYRSLVRAKVEGIVMTQHPEESKEFATAFRGRSNYLNLASRLVERQAPTLWITHGLSGSGKSTGAEEVVRKHGAIRIRADVERKRLFGKEATYRASAPELKQLYSIEMSQQTYTRLHSLALTLLQAGYSAIVDATFLERKQRAMFASLAKEQSVRFEILDFQASYETLKARVKNRVAVENDPSDANLAVLERQIELDEPLDEIELRNSRAICE
jgi:aminoglycoside phosphotransferase family enzyme/predicted kinase